MRPFTVPDRPLPRHALQAGCAVAWAALLLAGCGTLAPATGPLPTQLHEAACGAQKSTLLVLLPGVHSDPQDFVRQGFISELRRRHIAADTLLVDAHLGYYRNRTVVDRLQADVFAPARAAGYRSIWLVGVSLGGFGALLHEELQPGQTTGVLLLAPYLGEQETTAAIQAAGGLQRWQPPAGDDVNLRLWRWLQNHARDTPSSPPLFLGFGLEDRFGPSHRLLAAHLPPQRVFTTPGGHDWPQWQRLWRTALDTLPLPRCEQPQPS
jgi:pimeloyl-ACP methyl ester carboxylesterase